MVLSETLRSLGDTAWCLWVRIGLAWAVFVPLSLLAVFRWNAGPVGTLFCMVGYIALLAAAFAWRFQGRKWLAIDLTGRGVATN